jgi:hypothetical protein
MGDCMGCRVIWVEAAWDCIRLSTIYLRTALSTRMRSCPMVAGRLWQS